MKIIINVQNYLKVCPSIPDLKSFLLVRKSNPDPHVLWLWMKNFLLAPLDHEPKHNMQKTEKYIQAAYHLWAIGSSLKHGNWERRMQNDFKFYLGFM